MDNKRNYFMLAMIGLTLILFAGIGYAFFSAIVSAGDNGSSIIVKTGTLQLEYAEELIGGGIQVPGDSISKTFNVKNVGDITASYVINFAELENEFVTRSDLVYTLTCTSVLNNTDTVSGTCKGKSETVVPSNSGLMLIPSDIPMGITHKYLLTVTFKETGINQNDNQDKSVAFKVSVEQMSDSAITYTQGNLAHMVQVGDYVDYDAGSYTTTNTTDTGGTFSQNVAGRSRNVGVNCMSADTTIPTLDTYSGWRVIQVSGDNVTLVSGSTPLCYNSTSNAANDISNLLNHDYSEFVNNTYAISSGVLTPELISNNVINTSVVYDNGFYDSNMDVLKVDTRYFIPKQGENSTQILFTSSGWIGQVGSNRYGVRPTVTLKADVFITGGSGVAGHPYTISTTPQTSNNSSSLTTYWENWMNVNNIKLRGVPFDAKVVNISFATSEYYDIVSEMVLSHDDGTVGFKLDEDLGNELNGYTEAEFKSDIQLLKERGQKVVLSVGGASGAVNISSATQATNLTNSLIALIDEYGFDGVDIDIEETIYPTYLAQTVNALDTHYGEDLYISLAPETVGFEYITGGEIHGTYKELFLLTSSIIDKVNMQLYNTGTTRGIDNNIYNETTPDFVTSKLDVMKTAGVPVNKLGVLFYATTSHADYITPTNAANAFNSYRSGGTTIGGTYVINGTNPTFNGLGVYSILYDRVNGFQYIYAMGDLIN